MGQLAAIRSNKIFCWSESRAEGLQANMAACFGAMRSGFFLRGVEPDLCRQS